MFRQRAAMMIDQFSASSTFVDVAMPVRAMIGLLVEDCSIWASALQGMNREGLVLRIVARFGGSLDPSLPSLIDPPYERVVRRTTHSCLVRGPVCFHSCYGLVCGDSWPSPRGCSDEAVVGSAVGASFR